MVMNSAWIKNNLRELKKTLGRFLAMVSIVALGVGFFVGLKSSRPAMVETCTRYLDETNFYDLQLISSLGFDPDAGKRYESIDGVQAAETGFSAPMLVDMDGTELVFQTHKIMPTLNQVTLTAGRMPEAPNECLADDLAFSESALGSELVVKHQENSPFSQDVYTIVGLGHSPQYLSTTRGGTSLGNGTLTGFLFLPPEGFDVDYATDVFIRLEGDHAPFTADYEASLEVQEDTFRPVLEQQGQERLDQIKQDARKELDDGWKEYNDGVAEYQTKRAETEAELADAQKELDNAKAQLADAERQLADGERQLDQLINDPYSIQELADARQQLDEGHRQYEDGLRQYEEGKAQYQQMQGPLNILISTAEQELTKGQAALNDATLKYQQAETLFQQAEAAVQAQQDQLYGHVAELELQKQAAEADLAQKQAALDALKAEEEPDEAAIAAAEAEVLAAQANAEQCRTTYETAKAAYDVQAAEVAQKLEEARAQLATAKAGLEQAQAAVNQYQAQLDDGRKQLHDTKMQLLEAEIQLEDAKKQLDAGEEELQNQLHSSIATAQTELANGRQQLENGRQEYQQGLLDLEDGKKTAHDEFAKAEKDLAQAHRELQQGELDLQRMDDPSYFVLTPSNNNGYSSFENDTKIIESIANVFPLFFFLVAALVCSSTMTRMVEEQRTQNGTLKALGYSDFQIMMRYAGYAGLAAIVGVIIGVLIGTFLFPAVIWSAYKLLYHIGELDFIFHWPIAFISLAAALLCCVGAACAAAWNDLRQMPASLMRPKAPKAGKRIFL